MNDPAPTRSKEAAAPPLGVDPIALEVIKNALLAMTEEQRSQLAKGFPESHGKPVWLLRELAGDAGDIADPAMQSEDVFRHCRDEIVRCLEAGLPRLLEG